jgi:hypothetical protein
MIWRLKRLGLARNARQCREVQAMEFGVGARGVALNLRGRVRDQLFVRIN